MLDLLQRVRTGMYVDWDGGLVRLIVRRREGKEYLYCIKIREENRPERYIGRMEDGVLVAWAKKRGPYRKGGA